MIVSLCFQCMEAAGVKNDASFITDHFWWHQRIKGSVFFLDLSPTSVVPSSSLSIKLILEATHHLACDSKVCVIHALMGLCL